MSTERIRALIAAVEEGSLTAVSEKLGYTTSGISRMIMTLEEETGFPLLVRSRSGVAATEECKRLLPAMHQMCEAEDRFHQLSGDIAGLSRGTIRVGTSYYAYYDWFAKLIAEFRRAYPGIEIEIVEGTSTELIEAMEEHRADLCIISKRKGKHDWIPLKQDMLLACVPSEHPLAGRKSFPVKAFAKEDFIELYPGKETDNSRMFSRCGVKPNVKYTTSDNYAAYAMVAAGLGVTCTNAIIGESFTENVVYLPLDPVQEIEIGIAIPGNREMSPAVRRFMEFAAERSG
jgi:DNA-binding transcriptional LysR family regulator